MSSSDPTPLVSIADSIVLVRGRRVLISTHLAWLYGVEPKVLMHAVKRNANYGVARGERGKVTICDFRPSNSSFVN